jgi:hypothetical protein
MRKWTADSFERQCLINFGVGLLFATAKIAFLGICRGWAVDTFRGADWGFSYGWCGGAATMWIALRLRRARISN